MLVKYKHLLCTDERRAARQRAAQAGPGRRAQPAPHNSPRPMAAKWRPRRPAALTGRAPPGSRHLSRHPAPAPPARRHAERRCRLPAGRRHPDMVLPPGRADTVSCAAFECDGAYAALPPGTLTLQGNVRCLRGRAALRSVVAAHKQEAPARRRVRRFGVPGPARSRADARTVRGRVRGWCRVRFVQEEQTIALELRRAAHV